MKELLKVEDVARLTGRCTMSIYRDIEKNRIPGVIRLGSSIRINADVFEAYINEGCLQAPAGAASK